MAVSFTRDYVLALLDDRIQAEQKKIDKAVDAVHKRFDKINKNAEQAEHTIAAAIRGLMASSSDSDATLVSKFLDALTSSEVTIQGAPMVTGPSDHIPGYMLLPARASTKTVDREIEYAQTSYSGSLHNEDIESMRKQREAIANTTNDVFTLEDLKSLRLNHLIPYQNRSY
jgi:predicted  nucleic acid-binding Zn-ribbon protein